MKWSCRWKKTEFLSITFNLNSGWKIIDMMGGVWHWIATVSLVVNQFRLKTCQILWRALYKPVYTLVRVRTYDTISISRKFSQQRPYGPVTLSMDFEFIPEKYLYFLSRWRHMSARCLLFLLSLTTNHVRKFWINGRTRHTCNQFPLSTSVSITNSQDNVYKNGSA